METVAFVALACAALLPAYLGLLIARNVMAGASFRRALPYLALEFALSGAAVVGFVTLATTR